MSNLVTRSFVDVEVKIVFQFPEKTETAAARHIAWAAMGMITDFIDQKLEYFPCLSAKISALSDAAGEVMARVEYSEEGRWLVDAAFHTELCKAVSSGLKAALLNTEYKDLNVFVPVRTSSARCVGVI
jgi:hypothetical protein